MASVSAWWRSMKNVRRLSCAGVTRRALDEDQAAVLARADQALYEAKATGKNKVIFI